MSLIDEDRQWFKAACGLSPDLKETPRDQAFCNYTILNREVFVVHDALADARFASNPLVTGSVNIRFYAGAPLNLGPDIRVGSLCLIDTKPRAFELEQVAILKQFARVVVDEIWLHRIMTTGQADDIEQNRDELDFDLAPVHTGAQIRAARALLRWSADRLARLAGVALNTVKRIEAHDGPPPVRPETLDAVARALSDNGVEWVFAPNRQAGARLGNAAPMGSLGEFAPPTERREPR
ncbi:MAG: diguanylate cyclase [Planctomycetaceae bacterium]|nr:diguanylate cyclase [Planctomycetaceae bacterium]